MSKPSSKQQYDFSHLEEPKVRIGFMLMGARSISPKITFVWVDCCGEWTDVESAHAVRGCTRNREFRRQPWRKVD
jgi:hypothetical protein